MFTHLQSDRHRPISRGARRLGLSLAIPFLFAFTLPALAQRGGGHGGGSHGGSSSGSHGSGFSGSHSSGYSGSHSSGYSGSRGSGFSASRGASHATARGGSSASYRSPGRTAVSRSYSGAYSRGANTPQAGFRKYVSPTHGSRPAPARYTGSYRGGSQGSGFHSGGDHRGDYRGGSNRGGIRGGDHRGFHGGYWGGYYRGAYLGWAWYPWYGLDGWWWGGPWWGWGWGWGSDWGSGWGWWPSTTAYAETGSPLPRGTWGIVKTDIEPEEAEVWLDGTYIGTAADFSQGPDYLFLKPGSYKLEFRLPNYETLSLDVQIAAGDRLNFDQKLKLEPGKSALDAFPPESKGMPQGRYFGADGKAVPPGARFDKGEAGIGIDDQEAQPPRPSRQAAVLGDRGRLRFSVTPEDAAIYVDDNYVGVGTEMNNSPRGVIVDAGTCTVTVSRPGFKTKTVEVEAKVGQPVDVVVDLEKGQ